MKEQLLIQNAYIVDGSGRPGFLGSLSVSGSRITGIWNEPFYTVPAQEVLDAGGDVLCPGFVDTHTHSDMLLLHDGRQLSSITQGVTTEILGQDGLSYAPLSLHHLHAYAPYLKGLDGLFGDVPLDFTSVEEYLAKFEGRTGVNVAYLVPHCALRLETAGFENRLLTDKELSRAKELLCQGMRQGARGFSTGLSYFPNAFSDTAELIELCKAVAKGDGVYVTHLRTVFLGRPFDNVEEALEIARRTGVKLHFSHYRTGGDTIGHTQAIMEKIDRAVSEGLDITLELYPYPYGASYAPMLVPPWASAGGVPAIMERLADPVQRAAIAHSIEQEFPHFDGMIAYAGEDAGYMGKTFGELARAAGKTIGEMAAELLYTQKLALGFHDAEPNLGKAGSERFEKDVFELLARPNYMVGSDAIHLGEYPHPRAYGSFARLLRLAQRHHFPLETLVERITALPCRRFGLEDRGLLQVGRFADMVLFDSDTVTDTATVQYPRSMAKGIRWVWVNGEPALRESLPTGALAGRRL